MLQLRDLSSSLLWLRACRGAGAALRAAIARRDGADVEARAAHFAGLLRLAGQLSAMGVPRFGWVRKFGRADLRRMAKEGLDEGLIVAGV